MNEYPNPTITLSVPIDTANLELRPRRLSFEDVSRPTSPSDSLRGIYIRSRPSSPTQEGESHRMSLLFGQYPGFDYTGFTMESLRRIKREEGPQGFRLAMLPAGFSASTSTLGYVDHDQEDYSANRSSQDTLSVAVPGPPSYASHEASLVYRQTPQLSAPAPPRVQFVTLEDGHGRPMYPKDSDARSIAPSVRSTSSRITITPLRAVRRAFSKSEPKAKESAHVEAALPTTAATKEDHVRVPNKRLPSVYKAFRKNVVKVLHRKSHSSTVEPPTSVIINNNYYYTTPPTFSSASVNPVAEHPQPLKSSSASLFNSAKPAKLKRRTTVESQKTSRAAAPSIKKALSIRGKKTVNTAKDAPDTALLTSSSRAVKNSPRRRARLRRSVSFSGYTDLDIVPRPITFEEELDEATTEALAALMRGCPWEYRPATGVNAAVTEGYVFERNVEAH